MLWGSVSLFGDTHYDGYIGTLYKNTENLTSSFRSGGMVRSFRLYKKGTIFIFGVLKCFTRQKFQAFNFEILHDLQKPLYDIFLNPYMLTTVLRFIWVNKEGIRYIDVPCTKNVSRGTVSISISGTTNNVGLRKGDIRNVKLYRKSKNGGI